MLITFILSHNQRHSLFSKKANLTLFVQSDPVCISAVLSLLALLVPATRASRISIARTMTIVNTPVPLDTVDRSVRYHQLTGKVMKTIHTFTLTVKRGLLVISRMMSVTFPRRFRIPIGAAGDHHPKRCLSPLQIVICPTQARTRRSHVLP